MNWLAILKAVLQLAVFISRLAERKEIEKALLNEIENLHHDRVKDARNARDDVMSGKLPDDPRDPNRRD
jgi:hypothetical protein